MNEFEGLCLRCAEKESDAKRVFVKRRRPYYMGRHILARKCAEKDNYRYIVSTRHPSAYTFLRKFNLPIPKGKQTTLTFSQGLFC